MRGSRSGGISGSQMARIQPRHPSFTLVPSVVQSLEDSRARGPRRRPQLVDGIAIDDADFAGGSRQTRFNTWRLLEPTGYVPPAEYEARDCAQAPAA